MNASDHDKDDLAWIAYRYIAGELGGAELARFEERLSTDQTARETVADVVDLCAALRSLPQQAFSPTAAGARIWPAVGWPAVGWPAVGWPAVGWMAVGAAACLALVLGLQSMTHGPGSQRVESNEAGAAGDRRLALSWTIQSSAHQNQAVDADEPDTADGAAAANENENSDIENSDVESSEAEGSETSDAGGLAPPDWVTAAIDTAAIDTAAIDTAAIDTAAIDTAAIDESTKSAPPARPNLEETP